MCAALYLILPLHLAEPEWKGKSLVDIEQVNIECQVLRCEVGTHPSLVSGLLSTTVGFVNRC